MQKSFSYNIQQFVSMIVVYYEKMAAKFNDEPFSLNKIYNDKKKRP